MLQQLKQIGGCLFFLPLLLLLLPSPASTMMFKSDLVAAQWDTWAFVEDGTYYAYYLITEHGPYSRPSYFLYNHIRTFRNTANVC